MAVSGFPHRSDGGIRAHGATVARQRNLHPLRNARERGIMLTRRQNTLVQLLATREAPHTGTELAQALGVTTRTVRSEIRPINDYLADTGMDARIASSTRRGYWLEGSDRDKLLSALKTDERGEWLPTLPEEREIYICFSLIAHDGWLTMEQLSTELLASKTTVSRDVSAIRKLVRRIEGVTLEVSHSHGIRLNGEEQCIRAFIDGFLVYYQSQFSTALRHASERFFRDLGRLDHLYYLLVDTLLAQGIVITGPSMQILAMEYDLALHRCRMGHELSANLKLPYREVDLPMAAIETLFDLAIPEHERVSMLQWLARKRFLTSPIVHERRTIGMQVIAQRFFETVRDRYGFDFSRNEAVREHIDAMISYHHLTFRKRNQLVPEIQDNYPFAYEIARCIVPIAEEVLGYHLQETEVCRFATRLVVAMDAIPQRLRTIVVVDSASYAELLLFKLDNYFNRKLVICGRCPAYQLEDLLRKQRKPIDLILTTVMLDHDPGIPQLPVSPVLNQADINAINDLLFRSNRSYRAEGV